MSLILLIRSLVSERCTYIIAIIFLLSKIIPIYFCYILKGLVYIIIITLSSRQSSFYTKYTKSNMRSFCDIRLISNTKYISSICLTNF